MWLWRWCPACKVRIWGGITWGYHSRMHFNEACVKVLQGIVEAQRDLMKRAMR